MSTTIFEDQHYTEQDYQARVLPPGTYDNCQFINCQMQGLDLSEYRFTECIFEDCDLSNAILTEAALQEVAFLRCKLLGVHFSACRTFRLAFRFEKCILDYCSFVGLPLAETVFEKCQLREVDFSEADLSRATFPDCDLLGAQFDYTKLLATDFRTAVGYHIDPEQNQIRGARFSSSGLAGLLTKYELEIED